MIADKSAFRWGAVTLLLGMAVLFCIVHVNDTINKREKRGTLCGPCDLQLRYNELSCVHRGVNPFRIWNREFTDNQFHGLARPDFDGPDCFAIMDFANSVHAYTPWHTVFFWWYGWLTYEYAVAVFFLLTGLALASVILFFKNRQPKSPSLLALYWSLLIYFYSVPLICVIETGNYGVLLAGFLVFLLFANEKKFPLIAGVIWAVTMIKPQLVVLLFWPLLFQRRYITIGTAVVTCLGATLVAAAALHESPFELLRETIVQGVPYVSEPKWWKPVGGILGQSSNFVRAGVFFLLCGWMSWWMRAAKPYIMRYVPPFILLPVWFYCPDYDLLVTWPAAYLILFWLFDSRQDSRNPFFIVWLFCALLRCLWSVSCQFLDFNPSGLGWIYRLVDLIFGLLNIWFVILSIKYVEARKNYIQD